MGDPKNAERVRRYFETLAGDGWEAMLALLPDDVEWHPYTDRQRKLWGTAGLRSFLAEATARGETVEAEMSDVETLDDDNVIVVGAIRRTWPGGESVEPVVWLYSFRDGRLWRASGHASAAEAREAARFMHSERVELSRNGPYFDVSLHEEPGGRTVLRPKGELDVGTIGEMSAAVERAARSGNVLIDLSGLTFMDSSGLRTLLEAARDAREQGWRLEIRRAPDIVHRVITMTGAERLLPFEPG